MAMQALHENLSDGLLQTIRARRAEIEQARRLPDDIAGALRSAGLFALAVPRALGGAEAEPPEILRVIESVSAADGSTGWCVMVALGNNVAAGYMPEAGAREVFADPTLPTAGIAAPAGSAVRVPGGVRVTGRWPFASGVMHAKWLWAGCVVVRDGQPVMTPAGPDVLHVCMPVREVAIHDTWFVSGLSGTGSHDVSADAVFVPDERTFRLLDPAGHRAEPLYQLPPLGWFVSQLVTVNLGIARGALDELIALAQEKVPTLSAAPLADRAAAQLAVARAEAQFAAARAGLHASVHALWDAVRSGRAATPREIAANRAAANHAAETGAEITRMANRMAGGSAIYVSSSLQRHMRDAEALTHHFTVAPHVWEDAGRVFLGRAPVAPVF